MKDARHKEQINVTTFSKVAFVRYARNIRKCDKKYLFFAFKNMSISFSVHFQCSIVSSLASLSSSIKGRGDGLFEILFFLPADLGSFPVGDSNGVSFEFERCFEFEVEEVVFEDVVVEDRIEAEEEGALEGVGEREEEVEGAVVEEGTEEEEVEEESIGGVESIFLTVCKAVTVQYLDRCRTSSALSEEKCVTLHILTGTHTLLPS